MATTLQAADIEVTPSLTVRERYSWQTHSEGLSIILSPALSIRQTGGDGVTQVNYQFSFQKQQGDADLNGGDAAADHHLTLSRQARWTPRLTTVWDGFLLVSPDLTQFSTETVTDQAESLLIPDADTVQSGLAFTASYETTPTRTLHMGFSLNDTRYQSPSLNDAIRYGISLSHATQITRADQARFSYGFTQNRIDGEKSDIHRLGAGYSRSVSPTLSVHVSAGSGYTTEAGTLTGTFGTRLSRRVNQNTFSLSASRNIAGVDRDTATSPALSARAGGGVFSKTAVTESLSLQIGGPIQQRLTGNFQATAGRNQTLTADDDPVTTYSAVAGVQYAFNEHWSGGLTYHYLNQRAEDLPTAGTFQTHSVSVALTWRGATWK